MQIFAYLILFFSSKFWKFAVTAANKNTELKIWSCESWTCLQSIRYIVSPNTTQPKTDLFFKAKLDLSANYLLLSDIDNRNMYVMQIHKNDVERQAAVSCVTEVPLPAPFLSFAISGATVSEPGKE